MKNIPQINIGLDEYASAVAKIHDIDKKVSRQNRKVTDREAKEIFTLIISLIEFHERKPIFTKIQIDAVDDPAVKDFKANGVCFFARTKTDKYHCFMINDEPAFALVKTENGQRTAKSIYDLGYSKLKFKNKIILDKTWYYQRAKSILNDLRTKKM